VTASFDPAPGRATAPVQRWERKLADRVGMSPSEIEERVATLLRVCAVIGRSPEQLLAEARLDCDPVVALGAECGADLVVRSFLIHNGVNTFGAIVCMPRTPEHLSEQGPRWTASSDLRRKL
jgi:hypothetical protein